jgi:hypothetical protein
MGKSVTQGWGERKGLKADTACLFWVAAWYIVGNFHLSCCSSACVERQAVRGDRYVETSYLRDLKFSVAIAAAF